MNQGKLGVVKQEIARVNIEILVISELKWTGMGEFNSDDHYIYSCGQESLRRNRVAITVNKRVQNAVLGRSLKNDRMISLRFQGKSFKITLIQVYALEIKTQLLLGRKVMTNLDSVFKSRDITLPTKVCLVKATVFPVVTYGCESWTVKKAEHRRIDAFEL